MTDQKQYLGFYFRYTLCISMLFVNCECTCNDLQDCFKKLRFGRIIGHTIRSKNGTGYRDCFNDCVRHAISCSSFNYDSLTGLCELTNTPSSLESIVEESGFINSFIPNTVAVPDCCTPNPCSTLQICIPLSSGSCSCVNECGQVSQPVNGQVTYTDIFSTVGTELPFTCNAGYQKLNTLTCLASGDWISSHHCVELCTFETSCATLVLDNSGNRDFELNSGDTKSSSTGCSSDHTTGNGQYYYFEASSPVDEGDVARLVTSFTIPAGIQVCVKLWFNMYGDSMGSLSIRPKDSSGIFMNTYLVANGNQGTSWLETTKIIPAQTQEFWIVIEGVRGDDTKSDICIDDVEIYRC